MDLAILEAIKYIKQISKKKVSLENILQRINKSNATNIDIDTLRIDVDNMLRNGIIDQDYKILKNHVNGDGTLKAIPFLTENTNKINENKNTASPLPLTQVTPNKSDKDPTLVTSDLEHNTAVLALPSIGAQDTPTVKTKGTLPVHVNNQKTFRLELDDISDIELKSFLMNEIYDLRQELDQQSKCLNKQEDLTELKTKLQYLEKENQSLKEENENKRKIIETVLNQNNELLKLNHEIYNKNNATHYQEKSIKECPKQDNFQVASKTAPKKIKQSLEKDMDNSNNNNRFISPNRFARLFYEDNNNDDNESITNNNTDSTKTLLNDQINKENFAKNYNNNNKNKNTGRPEVVINQYPENQTVYPRKSIVPGTNSYSESLGNSQTNSRNIKIFSDSIPKGIRIKQMNQQIKNGSARIHSFPEATSHQLLHYLDVNLDKYTDTVVIYIGINDILNSASNVNGLLSNIKHMIKKCRNFGVKYIFISGLVYTKRIITEFLEDVHLKLVNVCKEMQVYFIVNRNITGFYLFRDGLHLLESGKMLLANNFVSNFNNFLSVKHRPNLFP